MPLKVSDGMSAWIKDFKKSDAPQFKGKSEEERREMAIAAYLDAKRGPQKEAADDDTVRMIKANPRMKAKILRGLTPKARREIEKALKEARAPKMTYALVGSRDMKIYSIGSDERDLKLDRRSLEKRFKQPLKLARLKTAQSIGDKVDKSQIKENIEENKARQSADLAKAMAAFKKRGGKVKRVAPGKAAGYHGKDDPGADVHGMMDRPDTKRMPRKKVRSLRADVEEGMMKNMAIDLKDLNAAEFQKKYNMSKAIAQRKFGKPEDVKLDEAMREPNMRSVQAVMAPTKNAKEGVAAIMKAFKVDEKKAMKLLDAAIKDALGESIDETNLNELSIMTLNRYYKKALSAIHQSKKSHDASIMRGMDPSKDKATISKRAKGVNLAKSRAVKKIRGESVNEEMMFKVSVEGLPPMIMVGRSPGSIKGQLRKIVKQPSMIADVERMTKADVRKRYRDMAKGDGDEEA